jgi:diguanylate cyclase (GGDEF)-like protein/PAS domain S-box-containing protein
MNSARVRAADRSHTGKLIAFLSVAAVTVIPVVGYLIWSSYQVAIHNAETTTHDYAVILEARLEATLRRADADLWDLARTIPVAALNQQAVPRYARELNADLDSRLFNFKEIGGFLIADRYGDVLYTSARATTPRVNVGDRSYFLQLRDNPQAGTVFSDAVTGRIIDRPILVIARALTDARGSFFGVVFAPLELDHFRMQFQSLAIGPEAVVSLRRSDDHKLILRWPHLASEVNKPLNPQHPMTKRIAAGDRIATLQFAAQTDGILRTYSYQMLEQYPFYVSFGLSHDHALAEWRTRSLAASVSSLLLLGLVAWLLFGLWQALAREARVTDVLNESDERNRTLLAVSPDGIWIHNNARIVYANDALVKMLGYDGPEALVGREIYEFFVPEFRQALRQRVAKVVTTLERAPLTETMMLRHDGSRLDVETTATAFRQRDVVWNVSIIRDITERKRTEQALHDSAESLRLFTDNVPAITVSWDENLRCRFANKAFAAIFGLAVKDVLGKHLRELYGEEVYREVEGHFVQALQGHPVIYQRTHKLPNGESRYVEVRLMPHIGDQGKLLGCFAVTTDVTHYKRAEQALRDSAENLRLFADNVPAMTASYDENLCCLFANKRYADFFGFSPADLVGRHLREAIGEEAYREVEGHFVQVLRGHPVTYQRTRKLANGESRYLEVKLLPHIGEHGKVLGCFAVTTDITEHKLTEERIQRMAHHDNLTGLPNRLLFNDRLEQALSLAKRDSRQFALLYLDLDRFKAVNDTLGHTAGDELLHAVAARVRQQVRESDTVARIGGDEFTVILPDIARREETETVARKIIAALAAPFQLGGQKQSVDIGTSIGIALYPTDGLDADALVKAADAAMYSAKQAGNSFRFFEAQ